MALAICLLFDSRTELAVRRLWDRLEDAGVDTLRSHTHGRHVPHLSYAVLRTWRIDDVLVAVEALPDRGPVELRFDGMGVFRRGRAWLIPAVSSELAARQEQVVDVVAATGAELHRNYAPGAWIPHCTIAPRVQLVSLPKVASVVYDLLPLRGHANRAALIDSGTGERWHLPDIP